MVLNKLLETLIEHTVKLDELLRRSFISVIGRLYILFYALQVHAQAVIDYLLRACSLLASSVATPIDGVTKLNAENLISEKEAELLKKMIGFRNIIVYEYGNIDVECVKVMFESRGCEAVTNIVIRIHGRLAERGLKDP